MSVGCSRGPTVVVEAPSPHAAEPGDIPPESAVIEAMTRALSISQGRKENITDLQIEELTWGNPFQAAGDDGSGMASLSRLETPTAGTWVMPAEIRATFVGYGFMARDPGKISMYYQWHFFINPMGKWVGTPVAEVR